jgi:hypothetical protein
MAFQARRSRDHAWDFPAAAAALLFLSHDLFLLPATMILFSIAMIRMPAPSRKVECVGPCGTDEPRKIRSL